MRITLEPAFVLHQRPYRETSVLLDLFTQEHGRISAVAKGVRQSRSRLKPLLQPFVPLLASWQGRSELVTLVGAEPHDPIGRLSGECLLSGLYLNELLVRVLPKGDPHPGLYTNYRKTLVELQGTNLRPEVLRLFEKKLLEELGYGLALTGSAFTREPICAEKYYRFDPEQGFELCAPDAMTVQVTIFSGKSLLALASEVFPDEESLKDAKRLMRLALNPLLGAYPLQSRRMYITPSKGETEVET
jgi:DNA repair protein RecO (recombination protein O)